MRDDSVSAITAKQYHLYTPALFVIPKPSSFGIAPDDLYEQMRELRALIAEQERRHAHAIAELHKEFATIKTALMEELTKTQTRNAEQANEIRHLREENARLRQQNRPQ